jgi:hypothetical protein
MSFNIDDSTPSVEVNTETNLVEITPESDTVIEVSAKTNLIEVSNETNTITLESINNVIEVFAGVGLRGFDGSIGPQGVVGEQGVQGVQGIPGPIFYYKHIQSLASGDWTIVHNLGKIPNVSVILEGEVIGVPINHIDINTSYISFATPQVGEVIFS